MAALRSRSSRSTGTSSLGDLSPLIDARELAGLTQSGLAARFGQSEYFVISYESGRRLLDPAEFIAIARAIGVDPYELLRQAELDVNGS